MNINKIVISTVESFVLEQKSLNESWYHGTPDARELEKAGGFSERNLTVEYVSDLEGLSILQEKMRTARETDDMDTYHNLLNEVSKFKKSFTYKKLVFLTDVYSVAKSYANPQRALDYQNSEEKVFEVDVNCSNIVKIIATGDKFRFINTDKVKNGFIRSGISEDKIDELIKMFNYYTKNNEGIKTDTVAAIGNWLGFDCIDLVGVLDSYTGGTTKSTVRMVLNPSLIKIKK